MVFTLLSAKKTYHSRGDAFKLPAVLMWSSCFRSFFWIKPSTVVSSTHSVTHFTLHLVPRVGQKSNLNSYASLMCPHELGNSFLNFPSFLNFTSRFSPQTSIFTQNTLKSKNCRLISPPGWSSNNILLQNRDDKEPFCLKLEVSSMSSLRRVNFHKECSPIHWWINHKLKWTLTLDNFHRRGKESCFQSVETE